eukprot:3854488-Pleurochrysis_carterae.AAC.1
MPAPSSNNKLPTPKPSMPTLRRQPILPAPAPAAEPALTERLAAVKAVQKKAAAEEFALMQSMNDIDDQPTAELSTDDGTFGNDAALLAEIEAEEARAAAQQKRLAQLQQQLKSKRLQAVSAATQQYTFTSTRASTPDAVLRRPVSLFPPSGHPPQTPIAPFPQH